MIRKKEKKKKASWDDSLTSNQLSCSHVVGQKLLMFKTKGVKNWLFYRQNPVIHRGLQFTVTLILPGRILSQTPLLGRLQSTLCHLIFSLGELPPSSAALSYPHTSVYAQANRHTHSGYTSSTCHVKFSPFSASPNNSSGRCSSKM